MPIHKGLSVERGALFTRKYLRRKVCTMSRPFPITGAANMLRAQHVNMANLVSTSSETPSDCENIR
jgi:hypothetical protein